MYLKKISLIISFSSIMFCTQNTYKINAEELFHDYTSPSGRYSDYSDGYGGSYTLDRGMSGTMNTLEGTDAYGNSVYQECYESPGGTYMECY